MTGIIILYSAVERAAFRSGGSLSAVLSLLCYSRKTHPSGSNSHGCLTLHFTKNGQRKKVQVAQVNSFNCIRINHKLMADC